MGLLQLIDFGGEDVVEAASEIIIKCILCVSSRFHHPLIDAIKYYYVVAFKH